MKYLRQSTASIVAVGPFLSAADGKASVTTLTAASTLNGRAISNGIGAAYAPATLVHDANGYYMASLTAGDAPSVGRLLLNFSDPATYCAVWHEFTVLSGPVYDSLHGPAALQTVGGGGSAGPLATVRQYRVMAEYAGRFAAGTYVSAADLGPSVDIPILIARGDLYDTGLPH